MVATKIFQSPFSGDFLCFFVLSAKTVCSDDNFQSPFSGDFLCFIVFYCYSRLYSTLSISIFRRLSLFLVRVCWTIWYYVTFNLHFQETFFVSCRSTSPFPSALSAFNLHFQETFFVSCCCPVSGSVCVLSFNLHFQETFFVSRIGVRSVVLRKSSFNLHFQETFFVSKTES